MKNLYIFLNDIFDPDLNKYLTEDAKDLIDSMMKDKVEQKIGAEEFSYLEVFITANYDKNKFKELSEKVGAFVLTSQIGKVHIFGGGSIHPILDDQVRGGALLLCGLNYYLRDHDYDLDETHDNVCGSKVVLVDNGLEDYIKDLS